MLAELHSHLYGCLRPDDLRWLAARNKPRWEIYEGAYRAAFGPDSTPPSFAALFAGGKEAARLLAANYYFRESGNFARFQSSFSLIIAVSSTEPEEIQEVIQRAAAQDSADFVEYRMLFSPLLGDELLRERVVALAEGARQAEEGNPDRQVRLAVSLLRDNARVLAQYEIVRRLVSEHETVRRFVTAIDFCSQEEGFPPAEKGGLFSQVLADNARDPGGALAILYHVGESFEDKSVESAVRWVVESARLGAHRLGHAIALGVNPDLYLGTEREEIAGERLAQVQFELAHASELEAAGVPTERSTLLEEAARLAQVPEASVPISYDSKRVERLRSFQEWAMQEVRKTGAVIESCPTSNIRIAGLKSLNNHPLPRFLRAGLRVVIGADDPGILDTSLAEEFGHVRAMGLEERDVTSLMETARQSRSEFLSGRMSASDDGPPGAAE